MVIEKLSQKYNVGCGRGQNFIDIPDLLFKLNSIIDPINSKNSSTDKEDNPISLELGDCFLVEGGQILAVDNDKLVQIISETGYFAIDRIFKEIISPEFELCFEEPDDYFDYSWLEVDSKPENLIEYTPKYEYWKIWRTRFIENRNVRPEFIIKVEIKDSLLDYTRELYFCSWNVYYKEEDFNQTEVEYFVKKSLSWFYNNFKPLPKK